MRCNGGSIWFLFPVDLQEGFVHFFCVEEFLLLCPDPDVDLGPDPDSFPDPDGKYNEADEDEEHRVGRQGRHLFPLLVCSALGLKKASPGANIY